MVVSKSTVLKWRNGAKRFLVASGILVMSFSFLTKTNVCFRFVWNTSHRSIGVRCCGAGNAQAQRAPPGRRSGCNRRVEILTHRSTAQRGGGSMRRFTREMNLVAHALE